MLYFFITYYTMQYGGKAAYHFSVAKTDNLKIMQNITAKSGNFKLILVYNVYLINH